MLSLSGSISSAPARMRSFSTSPLNMDLLWRKLSIVLVTTSLSMLAQLQLNGVDAAFWGSFSQAECAAPSFRKYSSRLWDIDGDWRTACEHTPARINSVYYDHPWNCVDLGIGGMWGEWKVPDSSCDPHWGAFKDDGCKSNGCRQFSSILWDIPNRKSWEDWCSQASANIYGQYFSSPSRCVNTVFHMWGEFDFVDPDCGQCHRSLASVAASNRGDSGGLARLTPFYSPLFSPLSSPPSDSPSG